jgi:hypothetical protein
MSKIVENQASNPSFRATHEGGCHCGAVRFEVALAPDFKGSRCNCSICAKTAATGAIVKPEAFRLLTGQDALARAAASELTATAKSAFERSP